MKNIFMMFAAIGMTVTVAAQVPLSGNQLNAAAAEGKGPAAISSFIEYYNSKAGIQPSQRNSAPVSAQAMLNPGFESGDFTGWTGYIGDNMDSAEAPLQNIQPGIYSVIMNAPLSDANARHTIMSNSSGPEFYGGFPVVPAGTGNYTARLGGITPNYQGEILEQTFMVDTISAYIKISYALVLHDCTHPYNHRPYFTCLLLDSSGTPITSRFYTSNDTSLTPFPPDTTVKYLPWVTDSISLAAYTGTNITLRFTVAGCTESGHFGYCYVNADYFNTAPNITPTSVTAEVLHSFSLFPNPANDYIIVAASHLPVPDENIFLMDAMGQEVNAGLEKNEAGWRINTTGLARGIYFVKISSPGSIAVQKVIIE